MSRRATALIALTLGLIACPDDDGAPDQDAAPVAAPEKPDPDQAKADKAAEKAARKKIYDEAQATPPADVAAAPADATTTATGLAYKVLEPGDSTDTPNAWDVVHVEYKGWTTDGKLFDSSFKRSKAASFPLNKVIPGWTEGVGLMKTGDRTRFWIPQELAYAGRPGAPAGMLVFEVELLSIERKDKPSEPPAVPEDVAAPPADATTTSTGLAYKVLKSGDGGAKPTATSKVTVHYTGWTTDGKQFDSSITRGKPATFPLNGVIAGWTEGLQFMSAGDSYRFWIPVDLAYQNRPGKPAGMLVFDVDLIKIDG